MDTGLFYPGYTQLTKNFLIELKFDIEKSIVARSGMPMTYESYAQTHCLTTQSNMPPNPLTFISIRFHSVCA